MRRCGAIKKATRAASEDDLQIITAKGAIPLRRCLQKALQGNAAVVSTIDDGQLMLKVEVLGKVAGKGRATGKAAGCAGRLPEAAAPLTQAQRSKQQHSATHVHVHMSPKLVLCTAGASRARSTGRSMARQASSSSAAATATSTAAAAAAAAPGAAETPAAEDKSSKLLSRVFSMWPKHTETVLVRTCTYTALNMAHHVRSQNS